MKKYNLTKFENAKVKILGQSIECDRYVLFKEDLTDLLRKNFLVTNQISKEIFNVLEKDFNNNDKSLIDYATIMRNKEILKELDSR